MIHKTRKPNRELLRSFHEFWNAMASEYRLQPISEWIDDEVPLLYLYETDTSGQCIGLCLLQDAYDDPWITLMVAKEHRRKQIATRLLEAAKKAVSSPALYFMSNTKEGPGAQSFLKVTGFEVFSRECIMKLSKDAFSTGNDLPSENRHSVATLRSCSEQEFRPLYEACFDLPYQPDEGKYFQILSEDRTPIGGVALTKYKDGWFLFDLCILPEYRRKGYARAAVAAAFREAVDGADLPDSILLHVSSLNAPAFALYEKMGFKPVEENILYELKK